MRLGIDLDGVWSSFDDELRVYLTRWCGWPAELCPPATRWEFWRDWGMSSETFLASCDAAVDAGVMFWQPQPYPGASRALRYLAASGFELHVKTDRTFGSHPLLSEAATASALRTADIPISSLTITADKTSGPLVEAMIEDKPSNYGSLVRVGIDAWLVDRPWNRNTAAWTHAKASGRLVTGLTQWALLLTDTQRRAVA